MNLILKLQEILDRIGRLKVDVDTLQLWSVKIYGII